MRTRTEAEVPWLADPRPQTRTWQAKASQLTQVLEILGSGNRFKKRPLNMHQKSHEHVSLIPVAHLETTQCYHFTVLVLHCAILTVCIAVY